MKVPISLYVTQPSDHLICDNGELVLQDPKILPCGHGHCSRCASYRQRNHLGCAECDADINGPCTPAPPFVCSFLDELEVKCLHHQNGCEAVLLRRNYGNHVGRCPFRTIQCANEGCSTRVLALEMAKHATLCPRRLVPCKKNCGLMIPAFELKFHRCKDALKEEVQNLRKRKR